MLWNTRKLNKASDIIFESAFISTGQRCTCARRLILPNIKSSKKLVAAVKNKSKNIKYNQTSSDYFYGPLISKDAVKSFLEFQDDLIKAGGKVILKGKKIKSKGNYVSPAIIDMTKAKKHIDKECIGRIRGSAEDVLYDAPFSTWNIRYE